VAVNPFKVTVYSKDYVRQGFVGNPKSLSITPRHNQQGTASITLDGDHRMIGPLTTPGARVVFEHKPWPTRDVPDPAFEFLMSGPVMGWDASGISLNSEITFQVADDAGVLSEMEGWPVPGAAITAQNTAEYAKYAGAAESILKAVVSANISRTSRLSVAADLGRGATVPGGVAFRFHSLAEKLLPALDAAGVGVQVRQSGTSRVLDVYPQRTYVHKLSEKAGTVTDVAWSSRRPTATRVVAGGKGEGTARVFAQYIDTGLEDTWGVRIERFKDATDVDTTADLQSRAQAEVADNGPKYGFSVKLSESGMFQYGEKGVRVGDLITVEMAGVPRTDVLRECTLAFNREGGPTQAPVIGDVDQSPERKYASLFTKMIRAISSQNKR
jgi:hypothetical protein